MVVCLFVLRIIVVVNIVFYVYTNIFITGCVQVHVHAHRACTVLAFPKLSFLRTHFGKDVYNTYVALFLFLITDVLKKTFEVGIEFKDDFKPEYEDLENAETKLFVNKVTDAVSAI